MVILPFLLGEQRAGPLGMSKAPQVEIHNHIPLRHPMAWIGAFPARPRRMRDRHRLLHESVLKKGFARRRQMIFSIGMRAHDHGIPPLIGRTKNIGPENRAVPHGDFNIAIKDDVVWRGRDRNRRPQQPSDPSQHISEIGLGFNEAASLCHRLLILKGVLLCE